MIPHPVLAHSWGWDEVLYFVIPVGFALLWIRWIEKRAGARQKTGTETRGGGAGDEGPADDPQP